MLYDCFKVEQWFRHALPFTTKNTNAVVHELKNMIFSNAVGIPFVAMVQGIVALIGYWIFGVEEFVLMGILTGIASVVPLVGTMIIFIFYILLCKNTKENFHSNFQFGASIDDFYDGQWKSISRDRCRTMGFDCNRFC